MPTPPDDKAWQLPKENENNDAPIDHDDEQLIRDIMMVGDCNRQRAEAAWKRVVRTAGKLDEEEDRA